ncbi:hypothetical protein VCHC17A2_3375A, partial [Vibrio cholerae HC-17A2]|jgi:hypothetical protein
MGTE